MFNVLAEIHKRKLYVTIEYKTISNDNTMFNYIEITMSNHINMVMTKCIASFDYNNNVLMYVLEYMIKEFKIEDGDEQHKKEGD